MCSFLVGENNREDISADLAEPQWFIDLDWYQQNNRSFIVLAEGCLCVDCRKRLTVEGGEVSATSLINNIKDCCSRNSEFITGELPILESVFRLFLANGNQPLGLEELREQLNEWRRGDAYRTSAEILPRLLRSDRYYGLRQVRESG